MYVTFGGVALFTIEIDVLAGDGTFDNIALVLQLKT